MTAQDKRNLAIAAKIYQNIGRLVEVVEKLKADRIGWDEYKRTIFPDSNDSRMAKEQEDGKNTER